MNRMMAPDVLIRNRNTTLGEMIDASAAPKPARVPNRIPKRGTRLADVAANIAGASPRRASSCSIRDVMYSPEFRHDSTAVTAITDIAKHAPGIPMTFHVLMNGES